jgi:hypothetical protein
MTPVRAVRSFFLLDDEEQTVRALSAPVRDKALELTRLARQKREAAELLRVGGARAESLALVRQAVELALEAGVSAGVDIDAIVDANALRAAVESAHKPLSEEDFAAEHRTLFRRLAEGYDALEEKLQPYERTDSDRKRLRTLRLASAAFVVLAFAAGIVIRARRPPPLVTVSSANYDAKHSAECATDGDEVTEWLLPDNTLGWIDVGPRKPRKVKAIRMLNAKNRPGPDRAVLDYKIEVFAGGGVARAFDGTFGAFTVTPSWKQESLGVDRPIERVRISVRSWSGMGGGLAEIQLVY